MDPPRCGCTVATTCRRLLLFGRHCSHRLGLALLPCRRYRHLGAFTYLTNCHERHHASHTLVCVPCDVSYRHLWSTRCVHHHLVSPVCRCHGARQCLWRRNTLRVTDPGSTLGTERRCVGSARRVFPQRHPSHCCDQLCRWCTTTRYWSRPRPDSPSPTSSALSSLAGHCSCRHRCA